ncbi:MAG: hypothetical protein RRB13_08450 [bacterium]|nr:hypothetical protein [bacterium]
MDLTKLPKEKTPELQQIQDRLADAIRAVINQQVAEKDPPETLLTLERLQEEGFSEDEAWGLVGQVVSLEVAEMFAGRGGIELERFKASLELLPKPFAEPKGGQGDEETPIGLP